MKKETNMKFNLNTVRGLFILSLLVTSFIARGQQDPMYTQYSFNAQTINPAYAGTWDGMGFLVLGRYQWLGMEGAPTTYTFSFQTPLKNDKVALGLNIVSDEIGREQHLGLFGDYSYRLQLGEKTYLRLGLKGGVSRYSNPLSAYVQNPDEPTDPAAFADIETRYIPNFGVGGFLYSKTYYIGFSVPKILQTDFSDGYTNYSAHSEMRHFYLSGGYVFNLGKNVKFKPTFLTKAVLGAPVDFDLTANFLLKEKIWLGAMYRLGDSFGFIAQWIFNGNTRIGYAVDFTTSKLRNYNNGTHEIMVSYEINSIKKLFVSPRYF